MFDDAQAQVERILSIVQTCPEKFQEKCFEMLLNAYLESKALKPPSVASGSQGTPPAGADLNGGVNAPGNVVPEAIRTRFNSLTTRTKVSGARGAELFDFNVDPFTFHGISVPGASNREKTRNVVGRCCCKVSR
ncbi:hypothetical protein [Lysobacter soli]|uniref:hypothetical protein n=1 Tax=Lysobacter soli TaxID=453783 RepID=UPI0011C0495F|nr:hypothetical protein [Lysobacter soli]